MPVHLDADPDVDPPAVAGAHEPPSASEPEPEPVVPAAVEPISQPTKLEAPPAVESETVTAPEDELPVAPAREEPAAVPEPSAFAPIVEQDSEPAKSTDPTPAAEPAVVTAPEPKPEVKSSDAPSSPSAVAPAINGHTKTASTASTSTAPSTLPTAPTRKSSRKFSFPGGWDKSGNSSPTSSARFSNQQKREKRHSLLGKLKEIFGDKEKKKSAKA